MKVMGRLLFLVAWLVTAGSLYELLAGNLPPRRIWAIVLLAGSALLTGTLFGGRLILWTLKDRAR